MKIAFDIDGTLTDNSTWYDALEKKFGWKRDDIQHKYYQVTGEQCEELINEYYDLIYNQAVVESGAVSAVRNLNKRHEIYYITARDEKYREETSKWLKLHGFPFDDSKLIFNRNKAEVCCDLGIKVLVEDCGEHLDELAEKNILVFLIERTYNSKQDNDWVVRFKNMNHFSHLFPAAELIMGEALNTKKKAGKKKNG